MNARQIRWAITAGILVTLLLAASPGTVQALTFDEIVRLKLADVDEDTILKVIQVDGSVFYLSVDDILDLRDVGCSNDFIRALIETVPDEVEPDNSTIYAYEDYKPFDDDDYDTVFINYYYDPFAYHWYAWPSSYIYYSPFWWSHTGFYRGGHWCSDWWDPWGPANSYCDSHWGFEYHFGWNSHRVHARRDYYDRNGRSSHHSAATQRYTRERALWQQAGLTGPPTSRTRSSRALGNATDHTDSRSVISRSSRSNSNDTYRRAPSRDKQSLQYRDRSSRSSRDSTPPSRDRSQRDVSSKPKREISRPSRSDSGSKSAGSGNSSGSAVRSQPRQQPVRSESKSNSSSTSRSKASTNKKSNSASSSSTNSGKTSSGRSSR